MVAVHGCSAPHSNVFFHWSILFPKLLTHLNQIAPPLGESPKLRCQLWWRHRSCSQKSKRAWTSSTNSTYLQTPLGPNCIAKFGYQKRGTVDYCSIKMYKSSIDHFGQDLKNRSCHRVHLSNHSSLHHLPRSWPHPWHGTWMM